MGVVEKVEERIDKLEQAETLNKQARYWVFGLVGAVGMAVLYAVLRNIGVQ